MSLTSILDLPNEVLNEILSYVVSDHHARVEFHDGHRWHSLPQVLVLGSVCRQFRVVVFDLPFWYQSEFEFRNLVDPNTGNGQQAALECAELALIQKLLQNKHLVSRFSLKTEWKFFHPLSFHEVDLRIPTFRKNTHKIIFSSFTHWTPEDWLRLVSKSLQRCVNVTSLSIDSCLQIGFLEIVLEACPLLEELELVEYPAGSGLRQAKNSLLHLRRLHVTQTADWVEFGFFDSLELPLQSVGVLTDFSFLVFGDDLFDYMWEDVGLLANDLSRFSKLTALEICPLSIETCQVITTALSSLKRLIFHYYDYVEDISEQNFVEMFSSPSLRSLSFLSMHFTYDEIYLESGLDGGNILLAITQNLQLLEEFELTFALSLDWLHLFANLKMLKRIEWDVSWEDMYPDPSFPHSHTYSFADSSPVKRVIESIFQCNYPSANETPSFDITINGSRPWFWDESDCDSCCGCSP